MPERESEKRGNIKNEGERAREYIKSGTFISSKRSKRCAKRQRDFTIQDYI